MTRTPTGPVELPVPYSSIERTARAALRGQRSRTLGTDDLANEASIRLLSWLRPRRNVPPEVCLRVVRRVIRNFLIDRGRKKARRPARHTTQRSLCEIAAVTKSEGGSRLLREDLLESLEEKHPQAGQIARMKEQDWSIDRIARELKLPEARVRVLLKFGTDWVRRQLQP